MMHSYQPMYLPYQHHPTDYYVLDLSKKPKRPASPDYTYGYPSPKSSPVSNPETDFQTILSPRSPKSVTSESSFSSMERSPKRKIARPFKTLAKDSIALSAGAIDQLDSTLSTSTFIVDDVEMGPEETKRLMEESAKKYTEFREKMLNQLRNNNTSNQNMRRMQNNMNQDPEYLEKRKKNNEAAKKSRDARRNKQDEIAIRATFLEQENIMLKFKVQAEVEDLERLRKMEMQRLA